MKRKRLVAFFLVLVMIVGLIPKGSIVINVSAAASSVTTRAQWIQQLTQIFEMTIDENQYPDNYFSDIDEQSEYYDDIMLATSFGVIDIEAGHPFNPNGVITREFAVHTLNFCLGYHLDESEIYTFSDSAACLYPDDAQIAINRGWVTTISGKFSPNTTLTSTEINKMLSDAEDVIASVRVNENYESVWDISNNIIEIPYGTDVTVDEDIVTIVESPMTINKGDKFVIYQGAIAVPYEALSVKKTGNTLTIDTTTVDYEETFDKVDAEGVIESNNLEFVAADGVELDVISEYVTSENARATKKIKNVKFKKDIKLSNNVTSSVNGTFSNIVVEYHISTVSGEAYVQVLGDLSMTSSVKVTPSILGSASVDLFTVGVPGIGGLTITADVKASGKLSATINSRVTAGLSYSKTGGMRTIRSFKENGGSNSTAEAEASIGVSLKCGITQMKVLSGYVYAKAGVTALFRDSVYTDGNQPVNCKTYLAYMYASYGATASCSFASKKFEYNVDVYDLNNSPFRVYHHYEDSCEVASCARGETLDYFTKWNSAYWGSGWYGGMGAYGFDAAGVQVPIYKYSLDNDNNATITKYYGSVRNLVIPDTIDGYTVVGIGRSAFENNKSVNCVEMPDTITTIDGYAFANCTNLSKVMLSDCLQKLEYSAFKNCSALKSIYIPKTITTVGYYDGYTDSKAYPFVGCTNISDVTFAEGITAIPNNLFAYSGISMIKIPNTITTIQSNCFLGCTNLRTVDLPDTIVSIGASAFNGCSSLSSINMPRKLESIGNYAFRDCMSLTDIFIPKSLTNVDTYGYNYRCPFSGCVSLRNVEFEEGITEIAYGILGNAGVKEISIPDTVTKINEASFINCTQLTKVEMPDSVTSIGTKSFSGCTSLADITLSKNLVSLGAYAFRKCTSLKSINLPKKLVDIGYYDGMTSTSAYPFTDCNNLETYTYDDGATNIPNYVFANTGLKSIIIPKTIASIGVKAFSNCVQLSEVKIEDGISNIGASAFANTNIENISLPDTVTVIGDYAFSGCTNLEYVKLPNTRKNIVSHMFYNCSSLNGIELPETVTYIRESAFENSGLEAIELPNNVTTIENYAFKNTPLKSIALSDKLSSIGKEAFRNCDNLTSVVIPNTVTSLGTYIFQDCDTLTDVQLGTGITQIPSYTFEHCDALEKITIPYSVTTIANNAFATCIAFNDITIPRATTSIDATAFSYPAKMTINGVAGTYAETFANEQGIKFVNNEVKATTVKVNKSSITLNKGATERLSMSVSPDNFTDEVSWKSTDTNVATVDNSGLVTAKGVGTATIKLTVGDASASCKITVLQPVTSISLNKTSLSLEAQETYKLNATIKPNDAANGSVEWSSSNKAVAIVDTKGNVTAISKGTATIAVKALDGSGISKTCTVTVTSDTYQISDVTNMQSNHPYSNNCKDVWMYTVPGASNVKVTFDEATFLEDGFDYVYILDKDNNEIGKYTGNTLAGKSVTISGDTLKIKLVSDNGGNGYGFKVKEIVSVDSEMPTEKPSNSNDGSSNGQNNQQTTKNPTQNDKKKKVSKPKATKIKKIKKAKRALKVSWKKVKGVKGYQLQYSTSKKFKNAKKKFVKKGKITSITIKKLKAKKKYYVRIRTYIISDGKKIYSKWSKVKSKKVK